jgi:uncharacterized protein (DUF488 family)
VEIFTIGFTRTTAADFFERLKSNRIERLLDVRLNNKSQLAGFAKRDDLAYFLRELVGAEYEHVIDDSGWELSKKVSREEAYDRLVGRLNPGPMLFGNRGKAVPEEDTAEGVESSLALIEPASGISLC